MIGVTLEEALDAAMNAGFDAFWSCVDDESAGPYVDAIDVAVEAAFETIRRLNLGADLRDALEEHVADVLPERIDVLIKSTIEMVRGAPNDRIEA